MVAILYYVKIPDMKKNSKILVLGSTGLVGSAVVRELQRRGYRDVFTPSSKRPDLRNYENTFKLFFNILPEYVFNCAGHAGGIMEAIEKPAEMLYDNMMIQANVIEMCKKAKVNKLLNFASSCIYPVDGEQPYKEEQIGDGKTDENWSYAVAKISGIEMCRAYHKQYGCNFMTVVPCNVYGINDDFSERGHVIPSLIGKFSKEWPSSDEVPVVVWGDGSSRREFIYSDDLANACVMIMETTHYNDLHDGVVNIGVGEDISIDDLMAEHINPIVADMYGSWCYEHDKPNGVQSKLMDSTRIRELGWNPEISLEEGIKRTYAWYKEQN